MGPRMDAVSQLNLTDLCVRVSVYEKILAFECVPCSVGVYLPLINSSCILSPVGSFVPHMAMSHHIQRQENFASTISGSAFCVPCPRNIFSNLQKTMCLSSVALIEEIPTICICNINIYSASTLEIRKYSMTRRGTFLQEGTPPRTWGNNLACTVQVKYDHSLKMQHD